MTRSTIALLAAASLALLSTPTFGEDPSATVRYDGYRMIRVIPADQQDLVTLETLGGRLLSCHEAIGAPTDYAIAPDDLRQLDRAGIAYEVLHHDLQALIDTERERLQEAEELDGAEWYDDFQPFEDIVARLNTFANDHPDLAQFIDIGDSIEGRDIFCLRITASGAPDRPQILLNGCQHAREWVSPMTVMYITEQLLTQYGSDSRITTLLDNAEFLIIPVVNPDGYEYSWDVDRLWRKNRRNNGGGSFGVDLNRNWAFGWGGGGSSGDPDSETYRGVSPFSEPESASMRAFYEANPNIVASIDFHSFGELILYPWAFEEGGPGDDGEHALIGELMASAIAAVHGVSYVDGPVFETLYQASGGSVDWSWGDQEVISYTIELRGPGFVIPPSEILPTAEENLQAVLEMSEASTNGALFVFPSGLPEVIQADATNPLQVKIKPITSGPLDPTSGELWWRTGGGGAYSSSPLLHIAEEIYEATLPAIECGQTLQYYLAIDDLDGDTYTSPPDAPVHVHEAEAIDITLYFADDFERDLGWAVVDSPGLTDGSWERGDPIGGGDRGDPADDADGSGQCYLTANDDGDSDVDGGTTTLISPLMDASDPLSVLSYQRWYSNDFGASPFSDTLLVEVSDDGGANWVTLEIVGPDGPEVSGGWYAREYVVAEIPAILNSDALRVRFSASDLGDGSVVEAAVDAVQVKTLSCDEPSIPGDIDGDGDVDFSDLLALLSAWGDCPPPPAECPADIDGSGSVDFSDLLTLLSSWS